MKRVLLISVVCVLLVSGWGTVLAGVLCPRIPQGHACHKLETPLAHDQDSSSHEEMAMEGMETTSAPAAKNSESAAFGTPPGLCAHCVGVPQTPATPLVVARSAEQTGRDVCAPLAQTCNTLSPFVSQFVSTLRATQNAPPGSANRRHLLISVFLI
jgi:hypothetical protein